MDPALSAALGEVEWGDASTVVFSRHLGLDIMDWLGMPVRITRRNVSVAEGRRALGDRITIFAGVQQLAGPMGDRAAVRASLRQMIAEAKPWDHFILGVAGYPNRTMEQTRFVVDCCREIGGLPGAGESRADSRGRR
jgi:hypothetical protein